ncbi:nuclear transport factor 2 family protein [Mycobacterium sp. 1245852.3]|uniref:nuclear transport factor 2 family protein n=1 Tax=Mycobacterium sp. 1245852.3 TaxID=1856860 RepID=UPI0012EA8980|nr:nuclear transport factor 2 family protein [Mycobacterium sp. 1245852.3]
MTTAREIFLRYAQAMADGDAVAAAACYTDDGVLDFPFWPRLGLTPRYQGRPALEAYLSTLLVLVPGFEFIDIDVHIDTPDAMFAEFRVDKLTNTARRFNFHYGGLVLAVDGKMKLLREFIDQVPAAIALLPNGIADICDENPSVRSLGDREGERRRRLGTC